MHSKVVTRTHLKLKHPQTHIKMYFHVGNFFEMVAHISVTKSERGSLCLVLYLQDLKQSAKPVVLLINKIYMTFYRQIRMIICIRV